MRQGTSDFTQPHFPIGGRTQVDGLRQFHREIGVCILFIDVPRGVDEHSDVKLARARRRHIFRYFLRYLQAQLNP